MQCHNVITSQLERRFQKSKLLELLFRKKARTGGGHIFFLINGVTFEWGVEISKGGWHRGGHHGCCISNQLEVLDWILDDWLLNIPLGSLSDHLVTRNIVLYSKFHWLNGYCFPKAFGSGTYFVISIIS